MPYIEKWKREQLDVIVDWMGQKLNVDGDLNYILYAFAVKYIRPSYNQYKNLLGELAEVSAEIRRRLLAPYENQKIRENGDIE